MRYLGIMAVIAGSLMLSACHTVHGVGHDVADTGAAITHATTPHYHYY